MRVDFHISVVADMVAETATKVAGELSGVS
jgi:hypothetical protein